MYKVTRNLEGAAGKFYSQILEYDIEEKDNRNILEVTYRIVCDKELAMIQNLKGKCTAILYVNDTAKEIYNGDIIFKDNEVMLITYTEIFTSEDSKKVNLKVVWKMEQDYEGIEESSILTNLVVPGLKSKIPVLVASLDYDIKSKRVFITTSVDKKVDFFEYKHNTGNWTRTTKDFYVDVQEGRNFLQVRAKQLDGVEFGYSNILKF